MKLVERIAQTERRTLVRETIQKALVSQSRSDGNAERVMFTHPSMLGDNPGPGAHDVARWTGEQKALPRHAPRHAFASTAERLNDPSGPSMAPDAVMRYLADPRSQQIGVPIHAQHAMQRSMQR